MRLAHRARGCEARVPSAPAAPASQHHMAASQCSDTCLVAFSAQEPRGHFGESLPDWRWRARSPRPRSVRRAAASGALRQPVPRGNQCGDKVLSSTPSRNKTASRRLRKGRGDAAESATLRWRWSPRGVMKSPRAARQSLRHCALVAAALPRGPQRGSRACRASAGAASAPPLSAPIGACTAGAQGGECPEGKRAPIQVTLFKVRVPHCARDTYWCLAVSAQAPACITRTVRDTNLEQGHLDGCALPLRGLPSPRGRGESTNRDPERPRRRLLCAGAAAAAAAPEAPRRRGASPSGPGGCAARGSAPEVPRQRLRARGSAPGFPRSRGVKVMRAARRAAPACQAMAARPRARRG